MFLEKKEREREGPRQVEPSLPGAFGSEGWESHRNLVGNTEPKWEHVL